ncbi:sulfotransferase domain-containing protein [Pelagibius marinus]|uniref:sulfotransferase domain-containing protein n=1 Tax=Pelagibius marinus TaxID=2762760 RepID=UPI0018726FD8|nr:sulfotransferase domain-containing protein [Pelagibius marinus]
MTQARMLHPARRAYRGDLTDPARWAAWEPRRGDILVSTPPKCGTTWAQTILSMLVSGGPDLPGRLPDLSPWIDADLGVPASEVAAALAMQGERRVVKTHTPADGFPVWDGVTVIAVYRHPLDVFFSLRKHIVNRVSAEESHPMRLPVPASIRHYLNGEVDLDDFDNDFLSTLTRHYVETALSGRLPELQLFHYADMVRDGRRTVERLAHAAGIEADNSLIESVTEATKFESMKSRAADYAPVGGTGFWKSDAAFFDSATSRKWEGHLSQQELLLYEARLAELVPDRLERAWLEHGDQAAMDPQQRERSQR